MVPRYLGGSHKEENLRPLCRSCNSRRKGTSGDELVSIYERELKEFMSRRTERLTYYLDSARFGAITTEHLSMIEFIISERRQLEDILIENIKQAIQKPKGRRLRRSRE
ncbi:HNH endonuclease [Laceyella putida]|uniref:HNH endonuclease n=1 Tax=Laceyella putida TaxID=110101 RepID=A0ABW2RNA6_9BACL